MQRINTVVHEPQVVYLTLTNDLTLELYRIAKEMAKHTNIEIVPLTRSNEHAKRLHQHFIISSIGTLLFVIRERSLDVSKLRCLYLDEVDMLVNSYSNTNRIHSLMDQLKKPCQFIYQSHHIDNWPLKFFCDKMRRMPILLDYLKKEDYFKNILTFHVTCLDYFEKCRALFNIMGVCKFNKIIVYCCGKCLICYLISFLFCYLSN